MLNHVKKIWGSEDWLVNTELYCAKYLNLKKGFSSSLHYHYKKDETFFILKGNVHLEYTSASSAKYQRYRRSGHPIFQYHIILKEYDSFRIEPRMMHRFYTLTPTAKILEISTHHDDNDICRLENGKKRVDF